MTGVQTCYRHPDQPAGIICQRCDRPICPRCMHQASVGFHCPECVKTGKQKVIRGPGALLTKPILTQVLIGINVAVFLIGLVVEKGKGLGWQEGGRFHEDFGLFAKAFTTTGRTIPHLGGVGEGEWYRMITSGFLHFGLLHLAMNMYALWVLGRAVEHLGGRLRYGLVYGMALVGGSLGSLIASPDALTAGASGAIFGLAGAIFAAQRAQGVLLRNSPLLPFLGINLFLTFAIPGISIGGHLGGLVAGAAAGWILFDLPRRPGLDKRLPIALCAALGVAILVAGAIFASGYTPS